MADIINLADYRPKPKRKRPLSRRLANMAYGLAIAAVAHNKADNWTIDAIERLAPVFESALKAEAKRQRGRHG